MEPEIFEPPVTEAAIGVRFSLAPQEAVLIMSTDPKQYPRSLRLMPQPPTPYPKGPKDPIIRYWGVG